MALQEQVVMKKHDMECTIIRKTPAPRPRYRRPHPSGFVEHVWRPDHPWRGWHARPCQEPPVCRI